MQIDIRPARASDIDDIAPRLRDADRIEVAASSRLPAADAMLFSLEKSALAMTATAGGRPEMIFGVVDLNVLTRTGAPWLLGTNVVPRHWSAFYRRSLYWRGKFMERYDVLKNAVDDRNELSKRWIARLGGVFSDPLPLGVNGELFRLFELRRNDV